MKKFIDEFAFWLGLITAIISVVSDINNILSPWIAAGLICFSLSCIALALILKILEKKPYPTEIDGIHINALDMIDQTFVSNPHLLLQEANIYVEVDGQDVFYTYTYSGQVIRTSDNQGIFFNSVGEHNDADEPDVYFGYDLNEDPNRKNPFSLTLLSTPGMSKKFFVPFQKTIPKNGLFKVEIHGIAKKIFPSKGTTYYFVRFAYGKKIGKNRIKYNFEICFKDSPNWVKSNEITSIKKLKKLGYLNSKKYDDGKEIFTHSQQEVKSSTLYVYTFNR